MRIRKKSAGGIAVLVLFLVVAFVEGRFGVRGDDVAAPNRDAASAPASRGDDALLRAFDERRSDVWVESQGRVERLLPDDNQGSRHQRFILTVAPDHTVLVSHNIDLAPRLEALEAGDTVRLRGEYEWNERGGVIHWTHRDPGGRHEGGFIEHEGRRYR